MQTFDESPAITDHPSAPAEQYGRPCRQGLKPLDCTLDQMRKELNRRTQEFRALSENSPDIIVRYDRDGLCLYGNATSARIAGMAQEEMLGKRPTELRATDNTRRFEKCVASVFETGEHGNVQLKWPSPDGRAFTYDMRLVPEFDSDHQIASVLAVGRDVTHLLENEWRLRRTETLARIGHWQWDFARKESVISAEVCRHFNMAPGWQPPLDEVLAMLPSEDRRQITTLYLQAVSARLPEVAFSYRLVNTAGTLLHLHTIVHIEYGLRRPLRLLGTTQDVSQQKSYESRLHEMAYHDPLTGLPNRALFNTELEQALAESAKTGGHLSLLVLDLDRFQEINDTNGHMAGDHILHECGERLRQLVRESDMVARLGGDEFGIVQRGIHSPAELEGFARRIVNALMRPIRIAEHEFFPSASIGIARYPFDGSQGYELLQHADSALSEAKSRGRSGVRFYSEELTIKSRERAAIEAALRRAEPEGQLALYYQPKVDLRTGECIGAEALLRWNHPAWGMVTPDRFIGIAEDSGIIVSIGAWVLTKACLVAHQMNRAGGRNFKVAVNLSPRQFRDNDLVATVQCILSATGCEPQWLELEITEGLLLENDDGARAALLALRAMGISIAIDDFGTGYSALAYLKRFPINVLKIDRSFVRDIGIDHDSTELVRAIISMARSLRLDLVAEGIETEEQNHFLLLQGCQMGQGYYHGRPVPWEQFDAVRTPGHDEPPQRARHPSPFGTAVDGVA